VRAFFLTRPGRYTRAINATAQRQAAASAGMCEGKTSYAPWRLVEITENGSDEGD